MTVAHDPGLRRTGTRFRLYPQPPYLSSVGEPETVWVSSPAGSLGPGPADDRMFVISPIGKGQPYGINTGADGASYMYEPPWDGPVGAPVSPDDGGHFDYLAPGMPGFEAAHLFGCVRFVLDVWEGYFGRPIRWHFAPQPRRLEISSKPDFDNAHAGHGFLETGSDFGDDGVARPFSLNYDIIAHEVGHLIIYSEVGIPTDETAEGEYYGFHESAADMVALLSVAHMDSVVDGLLDRTRGNLYVLNRLNRIGELTDNKQIRIASNNDNLAAYADGWWKEHYLSRPLTGAIFDSLVDIFHELLVERGLISPQLEDFADQVERQPEFEKVIQDSFDDMYGRDPGGFREAFADARDVMGYGLAETWRRLSPHYLNYDDVAGTLIEVDWDATGGRYEDLLVRNFRLRGIGTIKVGPRIDRPDKDSHAFSARTLVPEAAPAGRGKLSYRERRMMARNVGNRTVR